jgi:hypothetical protein
MDVIPQKANARIRSQGKCLTIQQMGLRFSNVEKCPLIPKDVEHV